MKRGQFHIPHFVHADVQNLLRGMIEVDPDKRLTLPDIYQHPWVVGGGAKDLELETSMMVSVQTHVLPSAASIDPDVLNAMCSLGCFKERDRVVGELVGPKYAICSHLLIYIHVR